VPELATGMKLESKGKLISYAKIHEGNMKKEIDFLQRERERERKREREYNLNFIKQTDRIKTCFRLHYYGTTALSCQQDTMVPATIAHRKDLKEKIQKLKAGGTSELE
jgi:hypothetical protein